MLGMTGLLSFAFTVAFSKKIGDEWFVVIAFTCLGSGALVLSFCWDNLVGLVVGLALIWTVAFLLLATTVLSSFSKILGSKPQGAMMVYI